MIFQIKSVKKQGRGEKVNGKEETILVGNPSTPKEDCHSRKQTELTIFFGMVKQIHQGLSTKDTRVNTRRKIGVAFQSAFVLARDANVVSHAFQ